MLPPPRRRKSKFTWLVIGVILGVGLYFGRGLLPHGGAPGAGGGMMGGMPEGGMPANVAEVIAKNVTLWSEFSGRIEATQAVDIRPRVGGQIVQVHFRDGEPVKAGQPLFTIDPRPYAAELARAKGALIAAGSAYKNAQQEFARAQKLIKAKAIAPSEFEQRASALKQAEGAFESAKGAVGAAEVNLGYAHIAAPISGKISRAEITAGNVVEAGANAPLLASIVQLSPIYASFELDERTFLSTIQGVPSAQLKKIPVEVGVGNSAGTPIAATIHAFDNQITPGSGTIRVRALIANKDGALVPGLFARVRIGTANETPQILINPAAVGTDQNKKFVLAIGADGKTEYREVALDGMSDGLQVVTSGLKEGDRIVVSGLQRLRPGTPVKPIPSDMLTGKPLAAPEAEAGAAPATPAATE